MFCTHCGTPLEPDAERCNICGAISLSKEECTANGTKTESVVAARFSTIEDKFDSSEQLDNAIHTVQSGAVKHARVTFCNTDTLDVHAPTDIHGNIVLYNGTTQLDAPPTKSTLMVSAHVSDWCEPSQVDMSRNEHSFIHGNRDCDGHTKVL